MSQENGSGNPSPKVLHWTTGSSASCPGPGLSRARRPEAMRRHGADDRFQPSIACDHGPHSFWRVGCAGSDGVGNLVNVNVAIEEEVIEAPTVQPVSIRAPGFATAD